MKIKCTFASGFHVYIIFIEICFSGCLGKGKIKRWYVGRTPPSSFEYPKINGFYSPREAQDRCEIDLQCGGFTFKGTKRIIDIVPEVYFFHFINKSSIYLTKEIHHPHWTTYVVGSRDHIIISATYPSNNSTDCSNRNRNYSKDYLTGDLSWKKITSLTKTSADSVAISVKAGSSSGSDVNMSCMTVQEMNTINFSEISYIAENLNNAKNILIIRIKDTKIGTINQNPMTINRCCKPFAVEPDIAHKNSIKDEIPRIPCNISREYFVSEYVQKRKTVILLGCQKKWPARKWTFEGLLKRYPNDLNVTWTTVRKNPITNVTKYGSMTGSDILSLLKSGYSIKIFETLNAFLKREGMSKRKSLRYKMDLFNDYSSPDPFPEDMFLRLPKGSPDQSYLMLGTKGTGTHIHIDPVSTDAFNALIGGHKWWVYLPSDIYEFDEELTCDETCSDFDRYANVTKPNVRKALIGNQKNALWFAHILPQLRSHKLYGKSVIDGVQHPSETIYMPHNVPHAVYNLDKTTAVGNNPFFNTAIEESAFGLYRDKNYPYGGIRDSKVYIHKGFFTKREQRRYFDVTGQITRMPIHVQNLNFHRV